MKTTLTLTLFLGVSLATSLSQVVVEAPALEAMTLANHVEHLAKFAENILELRLTKDRLGDAASILKVVGAAETLVQIAQPGVGKARSEITALADSAAALAYKGQGIYQAFGSMFVSRDGKTIARPDVFKPEAAIFQAVANHDAVHEDVMQRRQVLRTALRGTLSQLQAATTHAEVQKLSGVILAQSAELEATDRELEFATQHAVLLDIQNRANKERAEKAAGQEQAQEMQESLVHFVKALTPPTFISSRQ